MTHLFRNRLRDGFALPAALFAVVLVSAFVAGALFVATEELRTGRERQQRWKEDKNRRRAELKAAGKSGRVSVPEDPGPPANGFSLLPWLLMGMGALSHLFQGETPNPWIGGLGLLTFNSLYIYVAFRAFTKETRDALSTRVALVLLGLVTCALALGYGGNWLLFFPLLLVDFRHYCPSETGSRSASSGT